ncbi:MAG: DUF177 domain-containing protein [Pseudomonadota bacterium]
MIIDLATLQDNRRDIELTLEKEWWRSQGERDPDIAFYTPFQVKIEIYKAGDKFVIEGKLSGELILTCDRCLEPYHWNPRSSFDVFLARPPVDTQKTDLELIEEDMDVDFIKAEGIDIDDIIREEIFLSLPAKFLCKESCQGLCPSCGSNLNEGVCGCLPEQGHPAFSKLKHLKTMDRP